MRTNKTLIITVAMIVFCSVSAGGTYLIMNNIRQNMVNDLSTYYGNQMCNLTSSIYSLENDIFDLQEELNITSDTLSDLEEEFIQVNLSLQENISELNNLRIGDKYELHDPTYNEVASFIANDKTDEVEYDEDTFDCEQFSQRINDNAEDLGIRCAFVVIYFEETNTGHMIVGFDTVDKGMVYIEPQTDEWVENLLAGNEYWTDCVVPAQGYYYEDVSNDTVKEILIFW